MSRSTHSHKCCCKEPVLARLVALYRELIAHDGFGELRLDVRILKRKQKEVIITCGKQYRYVVDVPDGGCEEEGTLEGQRLEVPVRIET